jgi:hypothetical protein
MKIQIITISLTFCFGCGPTMKVTYKVNDVKPVSDEKLSTLVLDIEEFSDKRKENPANLILFSNSHINKIAGEQVCINAEKNYDKKETISSQLTQSLVDHINKKNVFRKVIKNKKDSSDYYITGNLTRFFGQQEFSNAALAGSQFGLIGAAATAGAKTSGKIILEISDLKIYQKNGQLVKNVGNFKKEFEDKFPADAYCWCIYHNVNNKLKEYASALIVLIETEIKNSLTPGINDGIKPGN